MAKINFPDIALPDYPLKITREDNILRSTTDAGYQITRQRYTRARKTYELTWKTMRQDDRDTLIDFFERRTANGSLPFYWINPIDDTRHQVRFTEPITESLTSFQLYSIAIKIMEV